MPRWFSGRHPGVGALEGEEGFRSPRADDHPGICNHSTLEPKTVIPGVVTLKPHLKTTVSIIELHTAQASHDRAIFTQAHRSGLGSAGPIYRRQQGLDLARITQLEPGQAPGLPGNGVALTQKDAGSNPNPLPCSSVACSMCSPLPALPL